MRLSDKVAIITGAARGIGKGIAMKFASEGAAIVVTDVLIEQAQKTADEIKSKGGNAIAVKADVTKKAEVQNLVKTTLDNFKALHILVNNAGIQRNFSIIEMSEEDWDIVLDVDLKALFLCTQAVLPHMMKQRYGKIINISSICGLGVPLAANYNAAKGGVIQLTKSAAFEAGPYGINVNSIAPGVVLTDILLNVGKTEEEREKAVQERKRLSVLGRIGTTEDMGDLAVFLASEESKHITGQVISCDGGRHDFMG